MHLNQSAERVYREWAGRFQEDIDGAVFYTDGTDLFVKWKNNSGTVKTGTIATS